MRLPFRTCHDMHDETKPRRPVIILDGAEYLLFRRPSRIDRGCLLEPDCRDPAILAGDDPRKSVSMKLPVSRMVRFCGLRIGVGVGVGDNE